jgi:hypothetical protein
VVSQYHTLLQFLIIEYLENQLWLGGTRSARVQKRMTLPHVNGLIFKLGKGKGGFGGFESGSYLKSVRLEGRLRS